MASDVSVLAAATSAAGDVVTRVRLVVPVAEGVDLSVDKEVDSFRLHVGRLRVELGAGQLVVRTGPDGAGAVDLLRVEADEGPKS